MDRCLSIVDYGWSEVNGIKQRNIRLKATLSGRDGISAASLSHLISLSEIESGAVLGLLSGAEFSDHYLKVESGI